MLSHFPTASSSARAPASAEWRPSCIYHEQLGKVSSLPPSLHLFSVHAVPSWGGCINPIPLSPSAAKALQSSAVVAVPRCPQASFCLLKGMLGEGMVAGCWHRASVKFPGWHRGEKAEHGAEPPAHSRLQSWKSQSSMDQTLHMKVHFHQLQLALHLFSSPSPLALQLGAQPPS